MVHNTEIVCMVHKCCGKCRALTNTYTVLVSSVRNALYTAFARRFGLFQTHRLISATHVGTLWR